MSGDSLPNHNILTMWPVQSPGTDTESVSDLRSRIRVPYVFDVYRTGLFLGSVLSSVL